MLNREQNRLMLEVSKCHIKCKHARAVHVKLDVSAS